MTAYNLRDVPDELWQKVRVKAVQEKLKVREVILAALKRYAAEGIAAFEKDPSPKWKGPK